MTLLEYVDVLRRHWRLILALMLVGGVAGYVWSSAQPNVYRASSSVLVSADTGGSASDLVQGSTYVENLVTSYAVMATSEVVLGPVIDELNLDTTVKALSRSVTAEAPVDTLLIDISANNHDPLVAQSIANAVADKLALAVAEVSPKVKDRPAVRVSTIQPASVPAFAISPNTRRTTVLGLALGLALGVALSLVLRAMGGRVTKPADVAHVTAAPLLGEAVMPRSSRTALPAAVLEDPRSAQAESLRTLAASMRYLNPDEGMRSLVVTSTAPAEGKSSIACGLALIYSETQSRVLLIDADLRLPALHDFTGLDNSVGLSTVLIGGQNLSAAVQSWVHPGLHVLTSGPIPPNPGQLLTSEALRKLLVHARRQYDVVVVDTGPLSMVSDAVWLSHHVDGVLVVARKGKARVRVLRQVLDTLAAAHAPASGVVLSRRQRRVGDRTGYGTPGSASTRRRNRRRPAAAPAAAVVPEPVVTKSGGGSKVPTS